MLLRYYYLDNIKTYTKINNFFTPKSNEIFTRKIKKKSPKIKKIFHQILKILTQNFFKFNWWNFYLFLVKNLLYFWWNSFYFWWKIINFGALFNIILIILCLTSFKSLHDCISYQKKKNEIKMLRLYFE